jgi:hypothetical protein
MPTGKTNGIPDVGGEGRRRRGEVSMVVVEPGQMVDAVVEDV